VIAPGKLKLQIARGAPATAPTAGAPAERKPESGRKNWNTLDKPIVDTLGSDTNGQRSDAPRVVNHGEVAAGGRNDKEAAHESVWKGRAWELLAKAKEPGAKEIDAGALSYVRGIRNQVGLVANIATKLTAEQRQEALQRMNVGQSGPDEALSANNQRTLARLALHDERAWRDFVVGYAEVQGSEFVLAKLLPAVETMPWRVKRAIFQEIARLYPSISLKEAKYGLIGKRSLDHLLRHVIDGEEIIKSAVAHGHTAEAAYRRFFTASKLASGADGLFGVDDVLEVAREIQQTLRNMTPSDGIDAPYVILGGSFVNGKAKASGSDIDCVLSHEALAAIVPLMESRVRAAMLERHGVGLPFGIVDRGNPEENQTFLSALNAVQLRITPDGVELLAFPKPTVTWSTITGSWQFDRAPTSYKLALPAASTPSQAADPPHG
jgi:hypothetical protein